MPGLPELIIKLSPILIGIGIVLAGAARLRKKLAKDAQPTFGTYLNELGGYVIAAIIALILGIYLLFFDQSTPPSNEDAAEPKLSAAVKNDLSAKFVSPSNPLVASNEPKTDHVYGQAHQSRLAGEFSRAIELFNQAIKQSPNQAVFYLERGQSHAGLGKLNLAIADFDKAIELKNDLPDAYNDRGLAYGNLGQLHKALEDFDQAIRLEVAGDSTEPKLAISHTNRGVVHSLMGQLPLARADFDRALELAPALADAHYQRAVLHRQSGDLPDALADLTRTIKLQPKHTGALYLRAFIQATSPEASLRNGQQAIKDASTACELTGWNDAGMLAALAAAYAEAGDFEKAREYKVQAIAKAPTPQNERIRSFLEPISRSQPVHVE